MRVSEFAQRGQSAATGGLQALDLRFVTTSKMRHILVITLRNALLNIITLTFYRFWGRTRVRRYLWSRTYLLEEPLEYTGRSLELFLGFLLTVVLLGVPLIGMSVAVQFLASESSALIALYGVAFYVGIFLLYGIAKYRAQRYRLSRTIWRSIRFGLKGSWLVYGLRTLVLYYITGASLFWTYPVLRLSLTKHMFQNTTFGDRQFRFEGHASALYPAFFFAWFFSVFSLVGVFGGLAIVIGDLAESGNLPFALGGNNGVGDMSPLTTWLVLLVTSIAVYALVGLVLSLTTAWYRAAEYRYFARCTTLDGMRFRFKVSGLAVFWLAAVNIFIVLFTFGFGLPFAQMRKFRFLFRRLSAEGSIDLESIGQGDAPYPLFGEGLAEFFEIGAI